MKKGNKNLFIRLGDEALIFRAGGRCLFLLALLFFILFLLLRQFFLALFV